MAEQGAAGGQTDNPVQPVGGIGADQLGGGGGIETHGGGIGTKISGAATGHRRSGSSSSEEDGVGGRRKKGLEEEKLPAEEVGVVGESEKKGVAVENIESNLNNDISSTRSSARVFLNHHYSADNNDIRVIVEYPESLI